MGDAPTLLLVRGAGVEPALNVVSGRCLYQLGYPRVLSRLRSYCRLFETTVARPCHEISTRRFSIENLWWERRESNPQHLRSECSASSSWATLPQISVRRRVTGPDLQNAESWWCGLPGSNRYWAEFKSVASTNWAKPASTAGKVFGRLETRQTSPAVRRVRLVEKCMRLCVSCAKHNTSVLLTQLWLCF